MAVVIRLLGSEDAHLLERVAEGVFDNAVDPERTREFMADPRHHLVLALDDGLVVGMASGVHYVHPDKAPQLFINEVGVARSHQGQGIGKQLLALLLAHGRSLNCTEAWVGTEVTNARARALYARAGGVHEDLDFVIYQFPLEGNATP